MSTMDSFIRPIPARRHPMQVFVAGLCALSGLPILFGGPRPGSVNDTLPGLLVLLWAAVLVLGGLAVVIAAAVPSPVTALYFELAAEPPLAVMCTVYAGCAFSFAGLSALVPAAIVLAAGVSFAIRAWQVLSTLTKLRRLLSEGTDFRCGT